MVEIIEHVGDDQLVPQQTGQAVAAEREKKAQNLRILLIDDNIVCLAVMTSQLKHCGFQVTSTREALQALDLLRRNTDAYDIVLTDVVRFDLSGFQLLGIINRQFGIPVIMITAMDDERVMAEGIKYGAIHYLVKPVRLEILQTVCEHAIRVRDYNNNNPVNALLMQTRFYVDGNENLNAKLFLEDDDDHIDDDDDDEKRKKKKKKDARISSSSGESSSPIQKKPRVVWDARLHHKFLEAVLRLDMDKAVPKKILEIMNEPNLTRENVASHLQKFRNVLRKERERFCQEMAKNPMEAMQHFLNPTIPPAPGLTINLHHHHYNNFSSGQEMMMSSSTNFPQQRSLHSAGNNFTHHSQQQLIQNMATTESSSSSSSSFSKTAETRMLMSGVMGYSTIDHRNQKNIFDQDSALQQLLVSPQTAAVPYQDTASSSSSSSSRGNNIGGGQSARPPTNVHPSQAAVGGDGGHLVPYLPGPTNVQAFQAALGGGADGDVSPYQVMMPTNVQPFQAAGGGGDVAPYQVMPPTNVLQSFQATVGGGGDVGLYQFMSPTNVQPFQNDVGGGGDVSPHQFMLPANVQAFQAAVSGGDGGDVAPYHFMPPINVQPFQASDGGGNSGDGDVASYQVMPPTNVQPFQAGDGGDVVVPYQAMPPTNVQPSQAGGGGGYVAGSSSDKGKKVHLSSSINDHVVDNYYYDHVMPTTNQSASDYSIEGNNNDGYLMLPSIISSNIVPYQASPSQPNTSLEESINNSIVPCQAKPTQQPYQPNDSIGGFIDNSVVPYQAMPTQQPFQPSASIGGSIENSIAAYQAMPSQANTSDEGSIDNFTVPYQARPTQELSQPTDSIGEFIGSSIVPYQAMPTHQLSQPTDSIGEFTDNSTVPYQAMPTHQPSQPTDSIGGFNDNSIVAYDQAWPTQPHTSLEETIDNSIIPYQAWLTQELSQPTGYIGGSIDNSIVPYQSWYAQNISDLSGSIGGNSGENNGQLLPSINSMVLYQDEHTKQPSQEIGTLGGNSGAVGYTQPYITDQSSSFSSLLLSPDENSYFNENNYGYFMQALPADSTNVVQGNNTNAEPVHDTFVGENINGFDHQMMTPSVADDSVPEINNIHENNIDDLPDDEINFMIDQLPNYGTSPSIR